MSLDWSIKDCAESPEVLTNQDTVEWTDSNGINYSTWAITKFIIFECMVVDMNGVTAKNADEFYARHVLFRRIIGERPILTPEMISRRIGLGTNVVTKSFASFIKRHADQQHRAELVWFKRYMEKVQQKLTPAAV